MHWFKVYSQGALDKLALVQGWIRAEQAANHCMRQFWLSSLMHMRRQVLMSQYDKKKHIGVHVHTMNFFINNFSPPADLPK